MKLIGALVLVPLGFVAIAVVGLLRIRGNYATPHLTYLATWSPAAAASYPDHREVWWQQWPGAQEDHGTLCVSCHTVVPYALARPLLRHPEDQTPMTGQEKIMLASVEKRVSGWSQAVPYYSDAKDGVGKAAQSQATEAVLNAVILASYDAGCGKLRPLTKVAFDEAWALQEQSGADAGGWKWQDFHLAPWESADSGSPGAAMLAIAIANTPDGYAADAATAAHVQQLRAYLARLFPSQPLFSQLYALWASAKMPGIVTAPQRFQLLQTVRSLQRPDGGWTLFSLDSQDARKGLSGDTLDDGCATGLVVLTLEESGFTRQDLAVARGLDCLQGHQEINGSWYSASLNTLRNPQTDVGRFMSDVATGYAVLALEKVQ